MTHFVISDALTGPDADGDGTPDYLDTSPWNEKIGQNVDFFCKNLPYLGIVLAKEIF